ncbi:MAG: hypothetical protein J7L51_00325, partial [Desulfurococcales archaeon]|nr:hypothetical protein [Desulfurococcales archaeon]
MLVEVIDESKKTSFIIKVDRAVEEFSKSLPFSTVLNVWKDEVYFTAPIKLELISKTYKIELGKVYYWPFLPRCTFQSFYISLWSHLG